MAGGDYVLSCNAGWNMAPRVPMSMLEGTVEAVNERGIRLGDEWLNLSKFKPLALPPQGAQVRVETDAKGFLKSVEVLDQAAIPTPAVSRRDTTITRLAVLKAAATFCGQRAALHGDVHSSDVLKIADSWLAWVNQVEPEFLEETRPWKH
jgi:hypothetical protein